MRVGVLTGGGDCPGLNAVIRAIVRKGVPEYGYSFLGFRDGWRGPLEALTRPLDIPAVRGLLPRGGTILGSSRTNPFAVQGGVEKIRRNLQNLGVEALIAIGGEDTLGVATKLHEMGVNVVGVPKTIDNYLSGTRITLAPPARPECSAIQPAWRPMTSTTMVRSWLSAVECNLSSASEAVCTAV